MVEPNLPSQASGQRGVDDRDIESSPDPMHNYDNEKLCEIARAQGIHNAEKMTREQLLAALEPGKPRNVVDTEETGPAPPAGAPDFKQ